MAERGRVLRGGVLPKPTKKKGRPSLHKVRILGKIKLSSYKPNQKHLDEALGLKKLLESWEDSKKKGSKAPGSRVV